MLDIFFWVAFIYYLLTFSQVHILTGSVINYAVREWRKTRGLQPGMHSAAQPVHDPIPSPTVSASRKKQKTSQSVASLSLGAPSPAMHPSVQPSSSALRQGPPPGSRTKKPKSVSNIVLED